MKSPTSSNSDVARGVAPVSGTIHYAALDALPDECQFPDDLAGRLWYEADQRRLAFRGFMSKATFDRLENLSKDPAYQRALELLFRECVYEPPVEPATGSRKTLIFAAVAVSVVALGLITLLTRFWQPS